MGQLHRIGSFFFDLKKMSKSIVVFLIAVSIAGPSLSGCVDLGGGGSKPFLSTDHLCVNYS